MNTRMLPFTQSFRLSLLKITWGILVIVLLGKFALGCVAFYQGINELCNTAPGECRDSIKLLPEDVTSLQADGITPEQFAIYSITYRVMIVSAFAGVGILIFILKRNDPAALFMSLAMVFFGTQNGFHASLWERFPQFIVGFETLETLGLIFIALFFSTFPNGRFVPRRIWIFTLLWAILLLLGQNYQAGTSSFVDALVPIAWSAFWLVSLAAQVYRYVRVSTAEERRQTKWVLYGLLLIVLLLIISSLFPQVQHNFDNSVPWSFAKLLTFGLSNLTLTILPISIAIAILRSRLWDIDLIIRKTLVYALLSGLLGITYFGVVALLQALLTTDRDQLSPLVIVATTLAIYILFNPLRRRIQDFIDRRFYRQKYDAEKALNEFAAAARSNADISNLTEHLAGVVTETMQPISIKILLKADAKLPEKENL